MGTCSNVVCVGVVCVCVCVCVCVVNNGRQSAQSLRTTMLQHHTTQGQVDRKRMHVWPAAILTEHACTCVQAGGLWWRGTGCSRVRGWVAGRTHVRPRALSHTGSSSQPAGCKQHHTATTCACQNNAACVPLRGATRAQPLTPLSHQRPVTKLG